MLNMLLSFLWMVGITTTIVAQNKLPREYIPPEELVSLNSEIDISTALDLLSEYAIQFARKPIYDPQKHTGSIGVDIRSLPWKKALGLILSRRGLWYVEKPRYIEVISAEEFEASLTGGGSIKLDEGVDLKPNSREVKIETVFFEGDRKVLKEIGLDWSTFHRGKIDIDVSQLGALDITENIMQIKSNIPKKVIGVDLDVLLKLFDSKKIGKVLAQPQVVVTEGKEGIIQVGQDFSIKERDFAGNIIDRFYSTGTILRVTPYIITHKTPDSKEMKPVIFLKIHVERSTAHPDVVSTIINKSQANSYLQLYDGEETLIAGLYSTEKSKVRKGVPILKDLPWWFLGFPYIFGYNRVEEIEKELVIIIKASLLKNVHKREKFSKTDVLNLKNSIVQNPDLLIKNKNDFASFVTNTSRSYKSSQSITQTNIPKTENLPQKTIKSPNRQPNNNSQKNKQPTYYLGKILKIKNKLALVLWNPPTNSNKINNKVLPVLRKDNRNKKVKIIGKAKILKTRGNQSVVKIQVNAKHRTKVKKGDLLVGKNQ